MRRISYTARLAQEAQQTAEVEVILVVIEHPDLEGGVLRLSSDPTVRISLEPLMYGTISTWRQEVGLPLLTEEDVVVLTDEDIVVGVDEGQGEDAGSSYLFVMMDALVPDEKDDAPAQASLILENLDSGVSEVMTSTSVMAVCHIAIVLASSPNLVEAEWSELKLESADIDSGQVVMRLTTESVYDEPYPAPRMTKERLPGLHR